MEIIVLNRMVMEGLTEKVNAQQRLEGGDSWQCGNLERERALLVPVSDE